jgi:hypothetical protein
MYRLIGKNNVAFCSLILLADVLENKCSHAKDAGELTRHMLK